MGRHLTDYRLAVEWEVQVKKNAFEEAQQDLGTKFNEPQLNVRVRDGKLGKERAVVTCQDRDGTKMFQCTICDIKVPGVQTMKLHISGKRHCNKLKDFTVVDGSASLSRESETVAAGLVPDHSLLGRLLKLFSQTSVLTGTEFIAEVLHGTAEPQYHCLLCTTACTVQEVLPHLLSASHQLAYLAQVHPELYLQFAARSSPALWGPETFNKLQAQVAGLKLRRKDPTVVASPVVFEARREQIFVRMEVASRM